MPKKSFIIITTVLSFTMFFILPNMAMANSIEYRGEAEGIITTSQDFFEDFGELMPGDKMTGKAIIKNTTKDKIEVFFKTEELLNNENYDEIDMSLLQKINLKIDLKRKNEEKNIYEGNLGAESMSGEYISLGTYEKGFDGEFQFDIEVPKELKNAYSLSRTEVNWVFYVVKQEENEPKPNDDGKDSEKNNNNENSNNNESEKNVTNTNSNNVSTDSKNVNTNSSNSNISSDNTNTNNISSNIVKTNDEKKNNFIDNVVKNVKTGDYIYYVIFIIILVCIVNIMIAIRRKNKNEK